MLFPLGLQLDEIRLFGFRVASRCDRQRFWAFIGHLQPLTPAVMIEQRKKAQTNLRTRMGMSMRAVQQREKLSWNKPNI
jgi:hypothetical protein